MDIQKIKKNCFFIVFVGDLEGAGTSTPHSQLKLHPESPPLLGLRNFVLSLNILPGKLFASPQNEIALTLSQDKRSL